MDNDVADFLLNIWKGKNIMNEFNEFLTMVSRLLIWWFISYGLIYIGSKLYFVDKLSVKIKLLLIVGVILTSRFVSNILVSILKVVKIMQS